MQTCRCYGCMEKIHSYPCEKCAYDPEKVQLQEYILQPGTILKGQYLVGRVLGQGGFGITYIGFDLALQRKVAVKEYFPSSYAGRKTGTQNVHWFAAEQAELARSSGMEMFLKEARKMSRVNEIENVVHVLDLFQENNTAYIVMDFIEGETLKARVKREGPLEWKDAQKLFFPVIHTMGQVHQAGLIHRDLSPDNLMLQSDGSAKILDLGAAKDLNINTGASSMQVAKGGFSPLEQYTQRGESGTWSDVYAMAATMYAALTGKVPPSSIDRMTKDTLDFSLPQCRKLPSRVVKALKHALMVRSGERTRTMEEFSLELSGKKRVQTGRGKKTAVAVGLTAAIVCAVLFAALKMTGEETIAANSDSQNPETIWNVEEETVPASQNEEGWEKNVLKMDPVLLESGYDRLYDSDVRKEQIVTITFQDTLAGAPEDSWDVSQAGDGSVLAWTTGNGERQNLFIAGEGGINGANCRNLFAHYINLESIAFNGALHTEYAWDFSGMFDYCLALQSLDLSSLDTSSMTRPMEFGTCVSLKELDLTGFDTSRLTSLNGMFSGCESLQKLDLRSFDTSNVTDMSWMFAGCKSLKELNLSSFDTSRVEDMSKMFSGCEALAELDVSSFDTSAVTRMVRMFEDCELLKTVDFSGFDTRSVTDYTGFMNGVQAVNGKTWQYLFKPVRQQGKAQSEIAAGQELQTPWADNILKADPGYSSGTTLYGAARFNRGQIVSVRFLDTLADMPDTAWDVSQAGDGSVMAWAAPGGPRGYQLCIAAEGGINGVNSARGLFRYYKNLESVFFDGNYHTEQVTDMRNMFADCPALISLDLSTLDTSNVTNMRGMFSGCTSMEELNLDGFDTSAVIDMVGMFYNCSSLKKLDLSMFQTQGLDSTERMFFGCEKLESLDLSSFDTSSVTNMSAMFRDCKALKTVEVGSFDTAHVEDMSYLFAGCQSLQEVQLGGFDTGRVLDVGGMFADCPNLTAPDLDYTQLKNAYFAGFMDEDATVDGKPWKALFESAQPSQQQPQDNRWEQNVMKRIYMGYRLSGEDTLFIGTNIKRKEIASVTFLDSLATVPQASWDFSAAGDRSVLAWTSFGEDGMHHLFIAGEGGVNGVEAGYMLFNNYVNMKQVHFNGNFHVEQAENISGLLHNCSSLIYVDANTLDTSSVVDMSSVFNGCESLRTLDLSGWDTSSAKRMNYMFWECKSLEQVDLGGFDTSAAEDMQGMFCRCHMLKSVDLRSFDTSRVANMSDMFRECDELTSLDLSNFDTSRAEQFQNFAEHTCVVNGKSWRELFA